MKQQGIFGTIVLIAAIPILIALSMQSSKLEAEKSALQETVFEIEEANFQRSAKELLFDNTINQTLEKSAMLGDAEYANKNINLEISSLMKKEFAESGLCTENFLDEETIVSGITETTLNQITKTSIIKYDFVWVANYTLTGGTGKNIFS